REDRNAAEPFTRGGFGVAYPHTTCCRSAVQQFHQALPRTHLSTSTALGENELRSTQRHAVHGERCAFLLAGGFHPTSGTVIPPSPRQTGQLLGCGAQPVQRRQAQPSIWRGQVALTSPSPPVPLSFVIDCAGRRR